MLVPLLAYRLSGADHYLVYATADEESFLLDRSGQVASFHSPEAARTFAASQGVETKTNDYRVNLDHVLNTVVTAGEVTDCGLLNSAWNFFFEVASSVPEGKPFLALHAANRQLYEKAFWGLNLPAVTPEGERYDPEWIASERETLREVLAQGLQIFISCVSTAENIGMRHQ